MSLLSKMLSSVTKLPMASLGSKLSIAGSQLPAAAPKTLSTAPKRAVATKASLSKKDLSKMVQTQVPGVTAKQADEVVEGIFDSIINTVAKGGWPRWGRLAPAGRPPQTDPNCRAHRQQAHPHTLAPPPAAGEKVAIAGFGNFERKTRAARRGRNPRTGEELTIAERQSPAFSAGKNFKDIVNGERVM